MSEGNQTPQYTTVELRLIEDGWKMRAQVPSILGRAFEMRDYWNEWLTGPDALKVEVTGMGIFLEARSGCCDGGIIWDDGRAFSDKLPARLSENRDEAISHNPEQGVFRLWSKEGPPPNSQG